MSDNVAPEEAAALQEPLEEVAAPTQREVQGRDFRRPKRLSSALLAELRDALQSGLTRVDTAVRGLLGDDATCDLDDVSEESAESVVTQLRPPLAAGRFDVGGQPAWIAWQIEPALNAVGSLLGEAPQASREPRPLSHVERRILRGLFSDLAAALLGVFDLPAPEVTLVREAYELGSWREGDPAGADTHRVCIGIAVEGPLPRSVIRLWLPGFQPATAGDGADGRGAALPAHLSQVDVRVHALLGRCEIPLADLMSLEEGDVIPLDGEAGRVELTVEDQTCAVGRLGQRHGKYALRLEQILGPAPNHEEPS